MQVKPLFFFNRTHVVKLKYEEGLTIDSGSILSTPRYLKSLCIHTPTFTTSTITLNMPTRRDFFSDSQTLKYHGTFI